MSGTRIGNSCRAIDPNALKAYDSTIEEARADLFGLFITWAILNGLNLVYYPTKETFKAEYYQFLMNGLMTQLTRIKPGLKHWRSTHAQPATDSQLGVRNREIRQVEFKGSYGEHLWWLMIW